MNNERRKRLRKVLISLEESQSELELIREEEQEAFDNLPDSIRDSERGEEMEEYISLLDEIIGDIESGCNTINEII